jgi:hypothetical protein
MWGFVTFVSTAPFGASRRRWFVDDAHFAFGMLAVPADKRTDSFVHLPHGADCIRRHIVRHGFGRELEEFVPGGLGVVVELAGHFVDKAADAHQFVCDRRGGRCR